MLDGKLGSVVESLRDSLLTPVQEGFRALSGRIDQLMEGDLAGAFKVVGKVAVQFAAGTVGRGADSMLGRTP